MDHVVESTTSLTLPDGLAETIAADRAAYTLPPRLPDVAERLIHAGLALLFPHYTREAGCRATHVEDDAQTLIEALQEALALPGTDEATRQIGRAHV